MKNEEKIIELLAEYLKKTDQAVERIDKAYESIKKHSEQFDKHSEQFDKHWQEITALRKDSMKMQIQNDVLLQEILSISKRVQNLEEK
jgi:predicted patatin/cPLA2 family phospholipase